MTRRRILVVDDDPGMLRAVRRILERTYEVDCATGSTEARALAQAQRPELAVLDIRMPDGDGFDLMLELKRRDPTLDVILMTGSVGDADRKLVRAIREKAFYFIQKPFDRAVLRTLVERCLELRRLSEENRRHTERLEGMLIEARAFQASLLPPERARFGRFEVSARYASCEALCGDLFDYAACGEGRVGFIVADVSGHGPAAAMLTGVVKSAFQSCVRLGFTPAAVVERIAAGIRTFRANRFVTVFCGQLHIENGRLDWINAGHPPAVVYGSGEPELLSSSGPLISPALGLDGWSTRTSSLQAGQALLVYTDGLLEARREEEEYGLDRLLERVGRSSTALGGDVLDGILDDLAEFSRGRPADDDVTLLELRAPDSRAVPAR